MIKIIIKVIKNEDLNKHNELIKDTLDDLQDQNKNKKTEKTRTYKK